MEFVLISEKLTEKKVAYEGDGFKVNGLVVVCANQILASSVWHSIYSQCFKCAFCCLGSEQGERPVNSSLLTLNHLFRWMLSSTVERGRNRQRKCQIKGEEWVMMNG